MTEEAQQGDIPILGTDHFLEGEPYDPDPSWKLRSRSYGCTRCGWYDQEDGVLIHFYCSMGHYLDD